MGAQCGLVLKHSQLYMNLAIVPAQLGVCFASSHPSLKREVLQSVCMYYAAEFLFVWVSTPARKSLM